MSERKSKEQDEKKEGIVNPFHDDDEEEEVFIEHICEACGCLDPVPEFIVAEWLTF